MAKGISIQSRKSKGRKCQQRVRDDLRMILAPYGIVDDDVKSTPMGTTGVDVQLSPAAKKLLDLAVECKAVEALNVVSTFLEHYKKYEFDMALKLLVHTKNRTPHLVTLRWDDFVLLLKKTLPIPPATSDYEAKFKAGFIEGLKQSGVLVDAVVGGPVEAAQ